MASRLRPLRADPARGLAAVLLLTALAGRPARADSVALANGNVMEGLITREDPSEIELDIGYGSVVLKKADISGVTRSKGKEKEALMARQKEAEFAAGRKIPEGGREVFEKFRSLRSLREKALDAKSQRERLRARVDDTEKGISSAKAAYPSLSAKLKRLSVRDPAYNQTVAELNELSTGIEAGRSELEAGKRKASELQSDINEYLTAMDDFKALMSSDPGLAGKRVLGRWEGEFYGWIRRSVSEMEKDSFTQASGAGSRGSHVVVNVTVNGKGTADLLVDTGASIVLLSRRAADLAGLGADAGRGVVEVRVADGRLVQAQSVVLDSVEVGKMRAEKVEAAVLPEFEEGLDGLLGMSFLKRFDVRVDGEGGRLILRELR